MLQELSAAIGLVNACIVLGIDLEIINGCSV